MKTLRITLLLALGLAACSSARAANAPVARDPVLQSPSSAPDSSMSAPRAQATETPESAAASSPPIAKEAAIDLARRDLSDRLQVEPSKVALVGTMDITWSNLLAGCTATAPQVLTAGRPYGYRVTLEAGGVLYIYHVGELGQVILCDQPAPGANNPLLGGDHPTQDPYNNAP